MQTASNTRAFRWFFLFWGGVVYLWGLWGGTALTGIERNKPVIVMFNFHLNGSDLLPTSDLPHTGLFTLLIALYSALLWFGLAGKVPRRLYWLYFPLQGVLILISSLLLFQINVALNLYLALTLAAIIMLKQPRKVISVALECVLLFLVAVLLEATPWRKGGLNPLFWVIVLGTLPSYLATILFVVGYILLYVQQTRAQMQLGRAYAELESAHLQLVVSAERIAELTRLTERQRLARELHDTLAQGLTGLLMQLEAIRAGLQFQRYPDVLEMVEQSLSGARTALAEARGAIGDLRAKEDTPASLVEAVQQEIQRFTEATGVSCRAELVELAHVPVPLCEQTQRMIAEGLSNIARHARTSEAWVTTSIQAENLVIEVGDKGIGFDPEIEAARAGHYGLLGLQERARLCRGACIIESAPGKGTSLFVRLPLVQHENGIHTSTVPVIQAAAQYVSRNERHMSSNE